MQITGIGKKQLKNWFTNARRRIWKPLIKKQLEVRSFRLLWHDAHMELRALPPAHCSPTVNGAALEELEVEQVLKRVGSN